MSESVYETLLNEILDGQLAPGHPVSELSITRRLGVSRTPVHEAIGQLVKDGLIEQTANRRPVVAAFTANDVAEIFDMRLLLESEAAKLACERLDRPTIESLKQEVGVVQKMKAGKARTEAWVRHDERFHHMIATSSGRRRLAEDIDRYRTLHRGINRLYAGPAVVDQAAKEHLAVLNALNKRDVRATVSALRAHIKEWRAYFVAQFR